MRPVFAKVRTTAAARRAGAGSNILGAGIATGRRGIASEQVERPHLSADFAAWIAVNAIAFAYPWDPYPFILLNLILAFQAADAGPEA